MGLDINMRSNNDQAQRTLGFGFGHLPARWIGVGVVATGLAGCASTVPVAAPQGVADLDVGLARATAHLVSQVPRPWWRRWLNLRDQLQLDGFVDANTVTQTGLTLSVEHKVQQLLLVQAPGLALVPFSQDRLADSRYLINGALRRDDQGKDQYVIDLSLIDRDTAKVQSQTSVTVRVDKPDTVPTPVFEASPVMLPDPVVQAYIRNTRTPVGQAADAGYLQQLPAHTYIQRAIAAYNDGKYEQALQLYGASIQPGVTPQVRALSGLYLARLKLGKVEEADQAFDQLVDAGLQSGKLAVKFLFKPGSTEFWPDPVVSGRYPVWLKMIASKAAASVNCLDVVGHTSKSGSAAFNEKLSEQRAVTVQGRLVAEQAVLGQRTRAVGKGFREVIVGTGTDDARDAFDRRVEFLSSPCALKPMPKA